MSLKFLITGAGVAALSSAAFAVPIFDNFGPLPQATFGGTGIPNDEVAAGDQFIFGDDVTVTVALSATQRFSNPPLTNDGAGTYTAGAGSNFGGAGESATEGALWNFNYYIEVAGVNGATPVLTDYNIFLYYDFDETPGTAIADLGRINITNSLLADPSLANPSMTVMQGSQNLLFSFLAADFPGFIDAPSDTFDPNDLGEYTFGLTVAQSSTAFGFPVETVAINVNVVPAPGAAGLLAVAGVAAARRRRS